MNDFSKKVVKLWALRGLVDFYLGFEMWPDKFPWYSPFFYQQGLEKSCKSYLLGECCSEYENLSEDEAWVKVDKIAKNGMGHKLSEMLDNLISLNVLGKDIKSGVYITSYNAEMVPSQYTGENLIKILENAYIQGRYPQNPKHFPRDYADTGKRVWTDIDQTDDFMKFSFGIGLKILKKIEEEFDIVMPKDKTYFTAVNNGDWLRFCRTFFNEDI